MKMSFGESGLTGDEGLRGEERGMDPGFSARQLRVPGASMHPHMASGMKPRMGGLGAVHRTMPHLMRRSGMPHFQVGGLSNPVGELLGPSTMASGANDSQYRNFLHLIGQPQMINKSLMQAPSGAASFGYADGGAAQPDPEDVASPDDEMSPDEQQEKQIVLNAMAALDGQSPNPEEDLAAFIDAFGARALADLQRLVESHHAEMQGSGEEEDDEGEEPPPSGGSQSEPGDDEDEEASSALQGGQQGQAGGGLLDGRGTGQSDEIEAVTPNGHPVLLSDGEYVIDAPTVAALGDGSTKAGARRLDDLRKQIRAKAYGHDKQAKPMSKGGRPGTEVVLRLK